jgi:hypothetical protein
VDFHEGHGTVREWQERSMACNNNNNNNIYLLQMGCHPVAVISLHVFPNPANKFTWGGLHEKHELSVN